MTSTDTHAPDRWVDGWPVYEISGRSYRATSRRWEVWSSHYGRWIPPNHDTRGALMRFGPLLPSIPAAPEGGTARPPCDWPDETGGQWSMVTCRVKGCGNRMSHGYADPCPLAAVPEGGTDE